MNKEYLYKVINQIARETRIYYKHKLIDAPFSPHGTSFPFDFSPSYFFPYFFKYCRNIYGLTEEETEYVWYEYKKIIKNKIKNKPLNESTEDNALNKIVDQLVGESKIDYDKGIITIPFHPQPISILNLPFPNWHQYPDYPIVDFEDHCRDIYGLNEEETKYVWNEYKDIINKGIRWNLRNKIAFINESTEDNALNKIVDQLVGESKIDYEENVVYPPYPSHLAPYNLYPPYYYDTPDLFTIHCRNIYGLTEPEIEYVWEEYKQIITDKIHKPLNESIEDNALNKIVDQLVSETDIDYENTEIDASFISLSSSPFSYHNLPLLLLSLPFPYFFKYCRDMYGLTEKETQYVWDKYKKIIKNKIKNRK